MKLSSPIIVLVNRVLRSRANSLRPAVCLSLRLLLVAIAAFTVASGATLPSGFTETQITGLNSPTAMTFAPDGRLFVCQQGGALRVIKNGALLATPFMTLTVNSSGERGLLGVAFDPSFATNNFIYVYYTATTPAIHNRVSRFIANGDLGKSRTMAVFGISLGDRQAQPVFWAAFSSLPARLLRLSLRIHRARRLRPVSR
ncbi:MAG: PQQ-dependent sugar dehydrogenase [bacterium]